MNLLRAGVFLLLLLAVLFSPDPDREYLLQRSAELLFRDIISRSEGVVPGAVELEVRGAPAHPAGPALRAMLIGLLEEAERAPDGEGPLLSVTLEEEAKGARAAWTLGDREGEESRRSFASWTSLLPPFLAIVAALLFQRTILALFLGVWLGSTLLSGGNPLVGLWTFFRVYLIERAILDSFRMEIIGFVVGLVALVGIISRGGGVQGMIQAMMRFVHSRRSAQLVTFAMGLVIFFDDYANTILVGSTMRPLTDRFRISREKLSYLVDSTAAPVAGLSLLSTWIAYEVSQFAPQIAEVGITENPYMVFLRTLPYRFYAIFTLLFILTGILLRKEYGPMLAAESRSVLRGEVNRPDARPMIADAMTRVEAKEGIPFRWWNAVLPLLLVVLVTLGALWITGNGKLENPKSITQVFSLSALREVLALTESTKAIAAGAWAGFFLAALLMITQRILRPVEIVRAAFSSTRALFFAIVILLLAWCIGGVCQDMDTAHYLVALFRHTISPLFYPILLFTLACLVSFSTGSSWSTMAIILPNSVALAYLLGEGSSLGPFGLTVVSIGAVLEGSIFGDHCSPISDTTILSSVSSAADHIDHVRTQIPYAATSMGVAVVCGYLPATRGVPPLLSIFVGLGVIVLIHRFIGRRPGGRKKRTEDASG